MPESRAAKEGLTIDRDLLQGLVSQKDSSLSFRELWFAIRSNRRLFLSIVGTMLGACLLYCLIAPNEYEATARVAMRGTPVSVLTFDRSDGASGAFASGQVQLETLANVFRSDQLAWDVITCEVARQYVPVFLSGLVASGGLLVDQSMAAMLPAGSVSALAYAGRFVSVALALPGGAISGAVTPLFSELVAQGDWSACRRTLRTWALSSACIASIVAAALILGARTLVRVTFQHGVFRPQDTSAVSSVLMMYALQIPFLVCSRVYYRFLVAMRRTDLVFYCGLLNPGLDVVLNLLLMRRFGVAGIALATSLWSVSTLIFLGYWSWRVLPRDDADDRNREG